MTALFARVLGADWFALPEPLRRMHDIEGVATANGRAVVERGRSLAARVIAAIVGFPSAGLDILVCVRFEPCAGGELWQRTFSERSFSSRLSQHPSGKPGLIVESFGPFAFTFELVMARHRLSLVPRGWHAAGIPLPLGLAPMGESYEFADDRGRFNFHVEIAHPWIGLIVRYRGYLVRVDSGAVAHVR